MKICITLDDVLRAKTVQIGKIFQKYKDNDIDLSSLDFSTNNYKEIFGFKSFDEYQKFLYEDYSFEIFAEAETTCPMVDKKLNLWHISLEDEEDIELMLANPFEFNSTIGFSYFFLSKIATRIREIYFPVDSSTIWDKCDVLVTADPTLINTKPEGKIVVKIENSYNKDLKSDFTYKTLVEMVEDKEIISKLKGEETNAEVQE